MKPQFETRGFPYLGTSFCTFLLLVASENTTIAVQRLVGRSATRPRCCLCVHDMRRIPKMIRVKIRARPPHVLPSVTTGVQ